MAIDVTTEITIDRPVAVVYRYAKNLPGRKSDVSNCEWLRDLHILGLLRGSFGPPTGSSPCAAISGIGPR